MPKVGDDQNCVLEVVEHEEEHETECQVGIRRLAQRGKKQSQAFHFYRQFWHTDLTRKQLV